METSLKSILNGQLPSKSGLPFLYDVTYFQSNKPKPVIVLCHGIKGFKDWGHFHLMSDFLALEGFVVIKMNFAYNGTTPDHPVDFVDLEAFGQNNFSKELLDVETLLTALTQGHIDVPSKEWDASKIHLLGHSKGGATVLMGLLEFPEVHSVATLAAVTQIQQRYAQHNLEEWKSAGVKYLENGRTNQKMPMYYQLAQDILDQHERFDVIERLKSTNKPALLIHGSADPAVPLSEMEATVGLNPLIRQLRLEGADHTFGGYHPYDGNVLPSDSMVALKAVSKFFKGDF